MTPLSILAELKNAVVWMISIFHLISTCSNPLSTFWGEVPGTQATTGITVYLIFQNFFSSPARSCYLSIFSLFLCSLFGLLEPRIHETTIYFFSFLFIN